MNQKLNIKDNIVFVHIPKNAGTSISLSLGLEKTTHSTALEIRNQVGIHNYQRFFKFAVIRDPLSRFISLYNYARMDESYYHNNLNPSKSIYGRHLDYEILKNASLYECALLLQQGKLIHDASWNHWKPQYTWIYDYSGKKKLVNKTYRLENLNELQNDLFELFKFKIKLEKLNISKNKNKLKEIDSKTMVILKDYYRKDFELFGY